MCHPRRRTTVTLGLAIGPAVSNGLSRFAYGLILPDMQADLQWSHFEAGALNTANALGYLAGALLTFDAISRLSAKRLFRLGMILAPLPLFAAAYVDGWWAHMVWRCISGAIGASVFITGAILVTSVYSDSPADTPFGIGLYYAGGGFGMIASGFVLPIAENFSSGATWPLSWLLLAALSCVGMWPSLWAEQRTGQANDTRLTPRPRLPISMMWSVMVGYFLFAAGYIIYLTYLVSIMRADSVSTNVVVATWVLLGLSVVAAPLLWRPVLSRSVGGGALCLVCVITGLAALLPLGTDKAPQVLLLSTTAFGLSFLMAPTAITNFVRQNLPEPSWGRAIAFFTIVFAVGQAIGPISAGLIADTRGSVDLTMIIAGTALFLGAAASAAQQSLGKGPT